MCIAENRAHKDAVTPTIHKKKRMDRNIRLRTCVNFCMMFFLASTFFESAGLLSAYPANEELHSNFLPVMRKTGGRRFRLPREAHGSQERRLLLQTA